MDFSDDPDAVYPCLSGTWVLRYYNTDHFNEAPSRGVSPIAYLNGARPGEEVVISQASEPFDSVTICVDNKSKQVQERFAVSKQLAVNHSEPEFLNIHACGPNFECLTIQRYGPRRDRQCREEYAVEGDKHTMVVTLKIQLSGSKRFTIKKYFTRKTASDVPSPMFFRGCTAANSQQRNIETRALDMSFGEAFDAPGDDGSDSVMFFVINMTHNLSRWQIHKRYNDFSALYKFLEVVGMPSLPVLPSKAIGKLKDDKLEQRKTRLQIFLRELCARDFSSYPLAKEVLLDFMQAPQHAAVHTVTDEDARRMLAHEGSGLLPVDPTTLPEIDPCDILVDRLSTGMSILKHGRQGRPHRRVLKCDHELKRLTWEPDPSAPEAGFLRRGASKSADIEKTDQHMDSDRSLELTDVLEVRKGTDTDPEKPTHTGTAILRRNCTEQELALSFALVTNSRSLHVQCLTKEDFTILYPSFRQVIHQNRRPVPAAKQQSPKPSRSPPTSASPIRSATSASPARSKDEAMKAAAKILFEEKKPSARW